MPKAAVCVTVYSIVMIILFSVFCYLMSIVNPEPLNIEPRDDGLSEAEVKLETFMFDDELVPPDENALYALMKADTEPTGMRVPSKPYRRMPIVIKKSNAKLNYTTRRVRPPMWARTTALMKNTKKFLSNTRHIITKTTSIVKNTEMSTIPSNITVTTEVPEFTGGNEDTEVTEATEVTESNTIPTGIPLKGRRRSIADFTENANDSVILRIIDDSGQLKIEIQLGPNGLMKRKNHETESTFRIGIEKNNGEPFNTSELSRNSTIKILANNTIIIDDFENVKFNDVQNFTNEVSENEIAANIDLTRTPLDVTTVTDHENVFLTRLNEIIDTSNTPIFTEVYALKVLFDNETKSFTNIVNHDEFNTIIIKDTKEEHVNNTEFYATNTGTNDANNNSATIQKSYHYEDVTTEAYDVINNSATIEKSYNYQDVITVL